jgi:hypothetical protein
VTDKDGLKSPVCQPSLEDAAKHRVILSNERCWLNLWGEVKAENSMATDPSSARFQNAEDRLRDHHGI